MSVTIAPSILGISFDGLAVSGIVNEFLNVAATLRGTRFRVLIDLGFDIKPGTTRHLEPTYLPSWVHPLNCIKEAHLASYTPELVRRVRYLVREGVSLEEARIYDDTVRRLAVSLVSTFARENVRLLLIENGTLPENPLVTDALLLAIKEHGRHQHLQKYVLWRDHDMMWSSEPHLYGDFPYPGVRKPEPSEHIHYAVTSEWMRNRMLAWAPSVTYNVLPCRFLSQTSTQPSPKKLREAYGIPQDDLLIARCTRIVPQKSVERDLRLLREIQSRLVGSGDRRKAYLFVSGPTEEHPAEFKRLRSLARELAIEANVIWADGLLPFHATQPDAKTSMGRFTIRELLAEADLSSFLTTYNYEGFGMPPGEAMAMEVPFISTTYELYNEIYGSKGAIAPLLPINGSSAPGDPLPDSFVAWTMRALLDKQYRLETVKRNVDVVRESFSLDALKRELRDLFRLPS